MALRFDHCTALPLLTRIHHNFPVRFMIIAPRIAKLGGGSPIKWERSRGELEIAKKRNLAFIESVELSMQTRLFICSTRQEVALNFISTRRIAWIMFDEGRSEINWRSSPLPSVRTSKVGIVAKTTIFRNRHKFRHSLLKLSLPPPLNILLSLPISPLPLLARLFDNMFARGFAFGIEITVDSSRRPCSQWWHMAGREGGRERQGGGRRDNHHEKTCVKWKTDHQTFESCGVDQLVHSSIIRVFDTFRLGNYVDEFLDYA